jgi:hypothetical protein
MPGMVRDSAALSKLWKRARLNCTKEKNLRAVIQNQYTRLDQYADGTSRLLAYIRNM